MADLKPCPFCGGTADPEGWLSTEKSGPACEKCSGSASTIEDWNTRPEEERLRDEQRGINAVNIDTRLMLWQGKCGHHWIRAEHKDCPVCAAPSPRSDSDE